jgi:hypothetical protein
MKRGIALDTTGWIILGIIAVLVMIGLMFILHGPTADLIAEAIDRLRFF